MRRRTYSSTATAKGAAKAGFTLMEMLVTLVLISFTTMLMFQMLGSYRVANERVQSQSGQIDRRALFQAWFGETINGLFTAKNLEFVGSATGFSGTTLNPLYASEGAPTQIEWRLTQGSGQVEIVYRESGVTRWSQRLEGANDAHFSYVGSDDKVQDEWPPRFGKITPSELPAMVMLVREGPGRTQPMIAAVVGPLVPPIRVFGFEQME